MMLHRLHYWEAVFFAGLFGAIALYPFTFGYVAFFLKDTAVLTILTVTTITGFLALIFSFEYYEHRKSGWGLVAAVTTFAALIMGAAGTIITSPHFIVWFIDIALALLTFGYILTKRLFQPLEKDFVRRWPSIVLVGLGLNVAGLLMATSLIVFPPVFIAFIFASFLLITLL